ncbi:MAG: GNAT family N-acetyltransferase [Tepidisphaeraceae bacterium]
MSELAHPSASAPIPLPKIDLTVRAGTIDDIPFMDALQKQHTRQVGWMPTKQFEGKIAAGHVLIAVDGGGQRVGYCVGNDRYFKRDEVGIIYQMNVAPGRQRGLVGATLLKEQFARSAYGCKLYCCWCAQDIAANMFWEAMGFVPIAFRTGSMTKGTKRSPRIHIFWQKRIRAGDTSTPYWYPCKTDGGALGAQRLVLPIPPGMKWSDEMPVLTPETIEAEPRALPATPAPRAEKKVAHPKKSRAFAITTSRFSLIAPVPVKEKGERRKKPRAARKFAPDVVAKARELRDRWSEQVSTHPLLEAGGKYDVGRVVESSVQGALCESSASVSPTPSLSCAA